MAQVFAHGNTLKSALVGENLAGEWVGGDVQRQRGHGMTSIERERFDHGVGLHGYFFAGRVHGRHPRPCQQVKGTAAGDRQTRRSNVDAHAKVAIGQGADRQRVVNFSRGAVIY